MLNEQIFFSVFLLFFGLFLIILIYLVFVLQSFHKKEGEGYRYLKVSGKFEDKLEKLIEKEIREGIERFSKEVDSFSDDVINSYRSQIPILLDSAREKISELTIINKEIRDRLLVEAEKEMKEFGNDYLRAREKMFRELKAVSKEVEESASRKISEFYFDIENLTKEKLIKLEKEIEEYKKEQIKKIDKEIYQILSQVAKEVLGKAIDISTHERLVIEALEKAKKEGIFIK